LVDADVVFYNGLELEGRMGEALEQVEDRGISAEPVAQTVRQSALLMPEEFDGAFDPHVWMDVTLWKDVAETLAKEFTDMDSTHAEIYAENLAAYSARLDSLDAWVRAEVEAVPEPQRVIVTAHDAFNYFGAAYGFEVRGLQGLSTITEAGAVDIQDLATFVAERQIPALFVETSVSERSIQAVLEAVRSRGWTAEIGGRLYSDALGDPGTPEGTYEGMIRHNVTTIVEALTGQVSAPAGPPA
ncbi:MAG: zinc ABC transporter substrate-binding protein, partial [Bacteroidota bacterium]